MTKNLSSRLLVFHLVSTLYLFLALLDTVFGVTYLICGWWGHAVFYFADLAFIAALYRLVVYPWYRRLKQVLREARVAELERELGM